MTPQPPARPMVAFSVVRTQLIKFGYTIDEASYFADFLRRVRPFANDNNRYDLVAACEVMDLFGKYLAVPGRSQLKSSEPTDEPTLPVYVAPLTPRQTAPSPRVKRPPSPRPLTSPEIATVRPI